MLSRLLVNSSAPLLSMALTRQTMQKVPLREQFCRKFAQDSRQTFTRAERNAERRTLRERAMAPAGPNG